MFSALDPCFKDVCLIALIWSFQGRKQYFTPKISEANTSNFLIGTFFLLWLKTLIKKTGCTLWPRLCAVSAWKELRMADMLACSDPSTTSLIRVHNFRYRVTNCTWPCVSGTLLKVTFYKVRENTAMFNCSPCKTQTKITAERGNFLKWNIFSIFPVVKF